MNEAAHTTSNQAQRHSAMPADRGGQVLDADTTGYTLTEVAAGTAAAYEAAGGGGSMC